MTATCQAMSVLQRTYAHRESFLQRLEALVRLETPSVEPETQERAFCLLQGWLREIGFRSKRCRGSQTGGFLVASPERRIRGRRPQLLVGHCDTVWPLKTIKDMPFQVDGEKVSGPGVYDMKAGVVMMLEALQVLQELHMELAFTPVLFINSDEEIGSFESTSALKKYAAVAQRAFILEPGLGAEGKLKTARKGIGGFRVAVSGRAAHAGLEPEKGASAILEMSHVIQKFFALNDASRGTTVNVGMVDGGMRANVIAPTSTARVDVRVLSFAEAALVEEKIRAIKPTTPGVSIEITGGFGRPPLEKTERNKVLWEAAVRAGKALGLELDEGTAGGGSDGNTTSLLTATLDGLGAVGGLAHNPGEFILLDKTLERTALLALLLAGE
jgi:glutamate carboxypeptidase